MNKKIGLSLPHMGGNELKYIKEAFDTNWIAPLGPNVDGFEQGLENYLGHNSCIAALSSGTAALHLALILAGVKSGDTVICQSFTFSASANPIKYQGANPVFVDSESESWNMCPKLLEKAIKDQISKSKKPTAIVVVHSYGMPANIYEIKQIANTYDIVLIEDAAEALGASIEGKKCGTFGDFGILSFNGNKIITTSAGGALICKNEMDKQKAVFLATQARDKAPHYEHSQIGYNYRMSNITAGIGRGQLEVLDSRVKARRANFEFYKTALEDIPAFKFLNEPKGFYSNRWLTCILTPSYKAREKLRLKLEAVAIESRPLWKPMHQQPIFKGHKAYTNGISDDIFKRGLCLPSGSNLTKSDLLRIVRYCKEIAI